MKNGLLFLAMFIAMLILQFSLCITDRNIDSLQQQIDQLELNDAGYCY